MNKNTKFQKLFLQTFGNERWLYEHDLLLVKEQAEFNRLRFDFYYAADEASRMQIYKKLVDYAIDSKIAVNGRVENGTN